MAKIVKDKGVNHAIVTLSHEILTKKMDVKARNANILLNGS